MDGRKFRLFMAWHNMKRQDVATAIGVIPNRISSAFSEGVYKGGTEVKTMRMVEEFTSQVTKELRENIRSKVQAVLPEGVEIDVILPTDDHIVVTVNGQLVGFYVPEVDKLVTVKSQGQSHT